MKDAASAYAFGEIAAVADGMVDSLDEMRRYHEFPENRRRCVIFTAWCEGDVRQAYSPLPGDFILCADAGYGLARSMDVQPDCVLGDFDSGKAPEDARVLRFPVEKDDTDTVLCLKYGLSLGYDEFLIVGGFGGRLDHTLANLQTLNYAASHCAEAVMRDGNTWARVIRNGSARIPRQPGKLSVFAMDAQCRGVFERGVKYPLEDGALTNDFPLGVSNEFVDGVAEVGVAQGTLLVMVTKE